MFKDNDISIFKDEHSELDESESTVTTDEANDDVKPTFIERVIGISRARKKNRDETVKPDIRFSEDNNIGNTDNTDINLSGDDLDIPSFLRRK